MSINAFVQSFHPCVGFLFSAKREKENCPQPHCQHFFLTLDTGVRMSSKYRQNKSRERATTSPIPQAPRPPRGTVAAVCSYGPTVRSPMVHATQRAPHRMAVHGLDPAIPTAGCSGGPQLTNNANLQSRNPCREISGHILSIISLG